MIYQRITLLVISFTKFHYLCHPVISLLWEYFEDLATPVNQPSFDEKYKIQVEEDNKTLHAYYNSNKEPLTEVNHRLNRQMS
jgi:hypothetical protein